MESIKFFALVALLVVSLRTSDAQVPAAYEPPINFRTGNIDLYRICETCAANFITQDYRADWVICKIPKYRFLKVIKSATFNFQFLHYLF